MVSKADGKGGANALGKITFSIVIYLNIHFLKF
jgi:hypothetical protein